LFKKKTNYEIGERKAGPTKEKNRAGKTSSGEKPASYGGGSGERMTYER